MDECGQQFAQHVGMGGSESFSQQLRPVDLVGSGHRVDFFARVTLVGLSKNHAITFCYPATTRLALDSSPPWWTQPVKAQMGGSDVEYLGECAVIACAYHRGLVAILDERAAVTEANRLNVPTPDRRWDVGMERRPTGLLGLPSTSLPPR
jgi:hypothetical protein